MVQDCVTQHLGQHNTPFRSVCRVGHTENAVPLLAVRYAQGPVAAAFGIGIAWQCTNLGVFDK